MLSRILFRGFQRSFANHSLVGIGQPYLEYNVVLNEKRINSLLKFIRCLHDPNVDKTNLKEIIFEELTYDTSNFPNNNSPIILPGGSILNSLRVAEWLTQDQGNTTFIGSCGNDYEAQVLNELLDLCNVNTIFNVCNKEKTAKSLNIILDEMSNSNYPLVHLIDSPGASKDFSINTGAHSESRIAFNSAKYILASFLPFTVDSRNNKAILEISEFASSANKLFCLKLPICNGQPIGSELMAKEWLRLMLNVDVLFLDLNSALKIAKIFADWRVDSAQDAPESIRPDVKQRFEEFTDSLKLDENAIYSMSVSLAATMPGLAERLAISLAHLPKRHGKQARIVFLLGSGTSTGGVVACTNHGKLKRLSDFSELSDASKYLDKMPNTSDHRNEMTLTGNGTDKAADAFVGGVMAKIIQGDVYSNRFLFEAMFVGAKVAHLIGRDKNGLFPKILPENLSSILYDKI